MLVTAGPTYEPIDAVRGITNLSSGRMGYAVARAALEAGAQVTLVTGRTGLEPPNGAAVVHVVTAEEMLDAVLRQIDRCDIFIGVAAVADYRVANPQEDGALPTLELARTPDILEAVARRTNAPFCVGFAAETHDLARYAQEKRRKKKIPLLAANPVQTSLGTEDNELLLFDDDGMHRLERSRKLDQARGLIRHIAKLYKPSRATVTVR